MSADPRRDDLAERLAAVEDRILRACTQASRPREDVRLVVVTKFFPAEDVARLVELGVTDLGENKAQEMAAKLDELDGAVRDRLTVHFIGQLQTNKARLVVQHADVVHAVDRPRLVTALERAASDRGSDLDVLLQVNLDHAGQGCGDGDPVAGAGRGGAEEAGIRELAGQVTGAAHLTLRGLMAVAPREGDAGEAFAELQRLSRELRVDHPAATWLSAGMSGDLEAAVAHGATHLRVGSAILGPRPAPR